MNSRICLTLALCLSLSAVATADSGLPAVAMQVEGTEAHMQHENQRTSAEIETVHASMENESAHSTMEREQPHVTMQIESLYAELAPVGAGAVSQPPAADTTGPGSRREQAFRALHGATPTDDDRAIALQQDAEREEQAQARASENSAE